MVGDDLQAIYGFRAASADHILDFPAALPGRARWSRSSATTAPRSRCSTWPTRSPRRRARAFRKALRAERQGGARAELVLHCRDEAAQADEVCERVLDAREEGSQLREQAVLMRASHDSDLLELELTRRRIPFVKYGGLRYLEAAHVKDFLALLRLADNPPTS